MKCGNEAWECRSKLYQTFLEFHWASGLFSRVTLGEFTGLVIAFSVGEWYSWVKSVVSDIAMDPTVGGSDPRT